MWNVAYFYNSGSLEGDDIVKQILEVVVALEFVGLKVKLQMCDAGGGNTSSVAIN